MTDYTTRDLPVRQQVAILAAARRAAAAGHTVPARVLQDELVFFGVNAGRPVLEPEARGKEPTA